MKGGQSPTPKEAEAGFARCSGGAHANAFAQQMSEMGSAPLQKGRAKPDPEGSGSGLCPL